MKNLAIVSHPDIDKSMPVLRDRKVKSPEFRHHADIISEILINEALKRADGGSVVAVPILRAGLSMTAPMFQAHPDVTIGMIGLERDEKTAIAREYYVKLPPISAETTVFVLDPMLATGGSMDKALEIIKNAGAKKIYIVTVICAPEGIARVQQKHAEVPIITAALDDHLDKNAYIVPGLGDFGDRYFGTD